MGTEENKPVLSKFNQTAEKPSARSDSHQVMVRRVGKFSFATLISRVLGYARDAAVAHVFGGGQMTDAFYTAFRISNLFRRLLGEGALSSSFVPVFSYSLKNESREEVQKFLSALFATLLSVLLVLTFLGIYFAPNLTLMIAPGFKSDPQKFELTVSLTRWIFPFFLFISLAALVTGVLNSLKHFFLPAVAPSFLSIAELGYLFFFLRYFSPEMQMVGLAISVVVGGALQFFTQIPTLFKEKLYLKIRWQWNHPHVIQVGKLILPAIIGLSADQINAFVDTVCATFLVEGSVTALYNSNRLMQLPLALFGISIAMVSLPTMSEHVAEKNYEKLAETLNSSLRMIIYTVLPASIGLIVLAHPIVSLLFQHGEFKPFATNLTVRALQGYCLGLVAYSSVKVLANAFYSLRIPKVPVKVAGICMGLNVVLCLLLMFPLGVGGLALASAIASWTNAVWLFIILRKQIKNTSSALIENAGGRKIITTFLKTSFGCIMMILFLWIFQNFGSHLSVALKVLIGISGGSLVFFICSKVSHMEEQRLVFNMLGTKEVIED